MPSIEEIDWNPKPVLRPGMDFHDGIAYFTVPLHRTMSKPGRGRGAEPVIYRELQTYTVTSERKAFWYDDDSLELEGFTSSPQVYQEQSSNWSLDSVKAYLDHKQDAEPSETLFAELRRIYTTFVEYTDEVAYDLMALFILYSYVFRLFESTGYVHFNGTAASGKSRNLAILNALAFNTVWASSMSAASLYRKLAGSPGTTCIDESEGFDGERGEELRRILNAGYKDGARAVRTEKTRGDRYTPVEYDVFGPKALASINPLEPVIASRCVVVTMRPAIRELPDFEMNAKAYADLRDRLYVWAMDNAAAVSDVIAAWRSGRKTLLAPKLIGRQWEVTSQFIILADYIGGEAMVKRIVEFFNAYFSKQQAALDVTDRIRTTLRSLPRVLATKQPYTGNYYSAKDIHEVISGYMEEDAKEYFKTKHVTKNLDTLGFRTKMRAQGGVRFLLEEDELRAEFVQRRVDPYTEDVDWLAGTTNYQSTTEGTKPWWDTEEDETQ